MKLRSALIMALEKQIHDHGWTPSEAARRLGVTQSRVSDLMRGRIDEFGMDTLVLPLPNLNTMTGPQRAAWYRLPNMAPRSNRTVNHATETGCLAMQKLASQCQAENKKSPQLRGLRGDFLPFGAGLCRTPDHSHSIVAGGFPEMSYTARLIPRTSLMIRFDTRPSSEYGRCAQCAVMKSVVCTARSAVT